MSSALGWSSRIGAFAFALPPDRRYSNDKAGLAMGDTLNRARPFWKSPAFVLGVTIGLIAVAVFILGRSRSGTPPASVIERIRTESASIEQELAKRGEHELQVRVGAATTQLVQALDAGDQTRVGNVMSEIRAINAQLSSLNIKPMASSLKVDPGSGRVTW